MKAGTVWGVALSVVVVASLLSVWQQQRPAAEPGVARITLDGELVQEIDLSKVGRAYSFRLEDGDGGYNVISVEPGRIRVSEADCPDLVCVRQGWIADATVPIVCLPHHLVIEIVGGGEAFDAATG